MTTRRDFLQRSAALGALAGLAPRDALRALETRATDTRTVAPMRLLVLGGTGFIGPHLVRLAVERGHTVSIFTRGRREAELPAGVERLVGDRAGQLDALRSRTWDAVFDDSATNPEWVRLSAELLYGNVGRYLFTSSTGVYYPYLRRGLDETAPVRLEITDPQDGSESFGVRKAQCERLVLDRFGERGLVMRPSYIVGPGDTTDRFPYWPQRLRRAGRTLAPGNRTDPVQFVDVRDLAAFMLHAVEQQRDGIFNVAGPSSLLTVEAFLTEAARALAVSPEFVWVSDYDVLREQKVTSAVPWILLYGNDVGHTSISPARAFAAGLTVRPIADTVRDTLRWWDTVPAARRDAPRFTISREAEAAMLARSPG